MHFDAYKTSTPGRRSPQFLSTPTAGGTRRAVRMYRLLASIINQRLIDIYESGLMCLLISRSHALGVAMIVLSSWAGRSYSHPGLVSTWSPWRSGVVSAGRSGGPYPSVKTVRAWCE